MLAIEEAAELLARDHDFAEGGGKSIAIHLFGVKHAEDLKHLSVHELEEVAAQPGLSKSYGTELRKMIRLSEFVQVK